MSTPDKTSERGAEASARPLLVSAGLVWWHGARLLVQRRPATARHGAGMLEFPGGKLERGEDPRQALHRELVEEWGPAASVLAIGAAAEVLHHVYPAPGPEVLLMVFHVDARPLGDAAGDPRVGLVLEPGASVEMHDAAALPTDAFLAADRRFVEEVRAGRIRPGHLS